MAAKPCPLCGMPIDSFSKLYAHQTQCKARPKPPPTEESIRRAEVLQYAKDVEELERNRRGGPARLRFDPAEEDPLRPRILALFVPRDVENLIIALLDGRSCRRLQRVNKAWRTRLEIQKRIRERPFLGSWRYENALLSLNTGGVFVNESGLFGELTGLWTEAYDPAIKQTVLILNGSYSWEQTHQVLKKQIPVSEIGSTMLQMRPPTQLTEEVFRHPLIKEY